MAQQKSLMKKTATVMVGLAVMLTVQAVARNAREHPGTQKGPTLVPLVTRTLKGGGITATNVTCADYEIKKGVTVNCAATIKGRRTTVRATFVDEKTVIVDPPKPVASKPAAKQR